MICPQCNGTGEKVSCRLCLGTGEVSSHTPVAPQFFVGDSTNDNVGWEGQPSES